MKSSPTPSIPVAIDSNALFVEDVDDILAHATGILAEHREYLAATHLGVLALMHDTGPLPAAQVMRSTRNIAPLQHALADLETIGFAVPRDDHRVALSADVSDSLRRTLEAFWLQRAEDARLQLDAIPGAPGRRRATPNLFWGWLRHMLIFVSDRGLRVTNTGTLHRSDLRRYESTVELPPRQFLEDCLAVGLGLGLLFEHNQHLIVGAKVDLLDLHPVELSLEILHRWRDGDVHLGLGHTSAVAGLFNAWLAPLSAKPTPNDNTRMGTRLFQRDTHHDALLEAILSPMAPEPVSAAMPHAHQVDLRSARTTLQVTHRRTRAGLLTLLGTLPRERPLPLNTVAALLQAHVALDMLRRPATAQRADGSFVGTLMASATWILPSLGQRQREHLRAWLEPLLTPTGLGLVDDEHLRLSRTMPRPPLAGPADRFPQDGTFAPTFTPHARQGNAAASTQPVGLGRLVVQPNGEVIAPPDASIHALIHLACGATPKRLDRMSTFTLSRRSLMRLSDAGLDVRHWAELLNQFSAAALPPTITHLIDRVANLHGEMTLTPAGGVLIARDPLRLKEVMSHRHLARHIILQPAPNVVVLAADTDLQQFLTDLSDRGFSGLFTDQPVETG